MKTHLSKLIAVTACGAALAACKTPQAALDQANNGAALTVALQAQLAELRTTQARVAQARIERIRGINAMIAEYEAQSAFDEQVRTAAGDSSGKQLASTLRTLADSRAKDDQDLATALATLDAKMASLTLPVPAQDAQLQATQKAMAALGEELPIAERAKIIGAFAADLKKAIDADRKQDEAQAPAQPATLQADAGSPAAPAGSH